MLKHPTEYQPKLRWAEGADPAVGVGVFERTTWDLLDAMEAQGMLKVRGDDSGIPIGGSEWVPYFVGPAEIRSALASAEAGPPPRPGVGELHYEDRETDDEFAWREFAWQEKWEAWLKFLRGAAERGGFWVGPFIHRRGLDELIDKLLGDR